MCLQVFVEHPDGAEFVGNRCGAVDQVVSAFHLIQKACRRVYRRLYQQWAVQAEGNESGHVGTGVHVHITVEGRFKAGNEIYDCIIGRKFRNFHWA